MGGGTRGEVGGWRTERGEGRETEGWGRVEGERVMQGKENINGLRETNIDQIISFCHLLEGSGATVLLHRMF